MTLYSYVVARDYGFAPNPFLGFCTLATCKPGIRKGAKVGDWIVGIGSKQYGLEGRLVYAMQVTETCSFDEYWRDPRFRQKRPNLRGSLKQAFGDNIYHRDADTGRWIQEASHHSFPNGRANPANVRHDTQAPRVLVSTDFVYWGGDGPVIPARFRRAHGENVCCQRGYKCDFSEVFVTSFVQWIRLQGTWGYAGRPREFARAGLRFL